MRRTRVAKAFLDTSIFFYAVDGRDPKKQKVARELIANFAVSGEGVVSAQVIQEFAHNAIKKLGYTPAEVESMCEAFMEHTIVKADLNLTFHGLRIMRTASISFWDANIVSAAEIAQCKTIYTEDLNSGQFIGKIRVVNPFV